MSSEISAKWRYTAVADSMAALVFFAAVLFLAALGFLAAGAFFAGDLGALGFFSTTGWKHESVLKS